MIVVGRNKLDEFKKRHADARTWINNWLADVQSATWTTSHDIKLRYATASFLSENVVIFNVRGNSYRLETSVVYATKSLSGVVQVNWLGTHAEYSKRKY